MKSDKLTTVQKAQAINLDKTRYGTFAEIGAGQEVARHFFQAGHASKTVAKTMSAYDKTFSDDIYGKGDRFVSRERLNKMLDHEYDLLIERLGGVRGKDTCFFAFANTVVTSSHDERAFSHCWMGVRFQTHPKGPVNEVILHVRMHDRLRLMQQEALGVLGVNLIFSAFYLTDEINDFVGSLIENIGCDRIEIDYLKMSGEGLNHIDNRLLSLELVNQGLTRAVMFSPKGEPLQATDCLFGRPVVVQKGTFRPITKTNVQILEYGLEQLKKDPACAKKNPVVIFEMSMKSLHSEGKLDQKDFLDRIDTIGALNHHVLVTNYALYSSLKTYLRQCTSENITVIMGASTLEKLLSEDAYQEVSGGLLGAMGQLFDQKTKVYVFPYKTNELCQTAKTFNPPPHLNHLFKYLLENNYIEDILGCDEVDTSIQSETVRKMLAEGDKSWEPLVPKVVRELIKEKKLFGYNG